MGQSGLPPEVRIEPLRAGGTRYLFPRRELGRFRYAGLAMIVAAGLLAFSNLYQPLRDLLKPPKPDRVATYIELAFFLPVTALAGGLLTWIGLFVLFGRTEVEVQQDRLRVRARAAFVRWSKTIPLDEILGLRICHSAQAEDGDGFLPRFSRLFDALEARKKDNEYYAILRSYPRQWCEAFAIELDAARTRFLRARGAAAVEPLPIERRDSWSLNQILDDPNLRIGDTYEQPATSRIELQQYAEGPTFIVPPAGIWRGDLGLIRHGLMFALFVAAFAVIFYRSRNLGGLDVGGFVLVGIMAVATTIAIGPASRRGCLVAGSVDDHADESVHDHQPRVAAQSDPYCRRRSDGH